MEKFRIHFRGRGSLDVTFGAIKLGVLASQRVAGEGVIEFFDLPILLRVAFGASGALVVLRTYVGFMEIPVAGHALGGLEPLPMISRDRDAVIFSNNVTLAAFQVFVRAFERIAGFFLMIEMNFFFPTAHAVAGVAIFLRPLALEEVNIVLSMTSGACACFPEKADVIGPNRAFRAFFPVTFGAFELRVFAFQIETGLFMIERFFVDVHGIIIPPLVIAMAMNAGVDQKTVESALLIRLPPDLSVTGQTLFSRHAFSRIMTFEAVGLLEFPVRVHQWARRQQLVQKPFPLPYRERAGDQEHAYHRKEEQLHKVLLGAAPSRIGAMLCSPNR